MDTLKVKRAKNQQKLKEMEMNEQLMEFKSRIMEAQGAQQTGCARNR